MSEIPRYFAKDEVRRFFAQIPKRNLRDRVLFDLIYRHGLRRGEAARLLVDDVSLREKTLRVERLKGSRSGVYRLHPASLQLLRAYLRSRSSESGFLFPGRIAGTHICPQTIYHACRKYARAANLSRANPHAFRHSCGVHAANSRLDLIDIADMLGHRSLTIAMRYTAVSTKRREENYERIVNSGEFASTV
ncbi:MAG: tyrosine-type recombinase/integrase [Acidobacteria bacterium]|nr:tyrosine-type recombinase/integrase [Acidobacteriota bacterium]MBV9184188.1 tyrosine-type recombinase/integrase [Acidobacteriota bacterium]